MYTETWAYFMLLIVNYLCWHPLHTKYGDKLVKLLLTSVQEQSRKSPSFPGKAHRTHVTHTSCSQDRSPEVTHTRVCQACFFSGRNKHKHRPGTSWDPNSFPPQINVTVGRTNMLHVCVCRLFTELETCGQLKNPPSVLDSSIFQEKLEPNMSPSFSSLIVWKYILWLHGYCLWSSFFSNEWFLLQLLIRRWNAVKWRGWRWPNDATALNQAAKQNPTTVFNTVPYVLFSGATFVWENGCVCVSHCLHTFFPLCICSLSLPLPGC